MEFKHKGYQLLLMDYCDNCPFFRAEVEQNISTDIYGNINSYNTIRCEKRKECYRLSKHIEDKLNNG